MKNFIQLNRAIFLSIILIFSHAGPLSAQNTTLFQINGYNYGPAQIMDTSGTVVIKDSADYYFMCDSVIVCKSKNHYSLRNLTTLKKTADSIEELGCDMFTDMIYAKKGGKWGYYNEKGQLKIRHQYEEASGFYDGIALVKKAGKYYYINKNGAITKNITPEVREHFNTFGTESINAVSSLPGFRLEDYETFRENELWGIKNSSTGEIILEARFDQIVTNANELVVVIKDSKYGIINLKTGKFITDCKHKYIHILTQ